LFAGTARPLNVFNVRGLLGVNRLSPDEVMTNNMRAQAASAQVSPVASAVALSGKDDDDQ
jgi:hypothetical protein